LTASISVVCGQLFSSLFFFDFHRTNFSGFRLTFHQFRFGWLCYFCYYGHRTYRRKPVVSSHQLWYLHLCADAGIVVVAYSDDASGVEIEQADGAGQFESVTLRPHAKLAAGSDENIARRLHDAAAEKCFIARSVSFKVEHKPTFEIASA
jgi:hypothetical protein